MQEAWFDRKFAFDYPVERIGVLLSRLRGTEHRIRAATRGVPPDRLTQRTGDRWSIQEHVGHLADLEALHLQRLAEVAAGKATLTGADLENRATWTAGHNERSFADVLASFSAVRAELLAALTALDAEGLAKAAIHPRLQVAMRAVDIAGFCAEHDDQHIATIEQMLAAAEPPTASNAATYRWDALPPDSPMPLVDRRRVIGRDVMLSHFTLHSGCSVPSHAHHNEQFACVLSGKVRFALADGERVLTAGEVLHLPSWTPHGAEAIETAVVLDVFAPPSEATGVDQPKRV